MGIPVTLIGSAVFSRCLSALKDERVAASKLIKDYEAVFTGNTDDFVADLEQAVLASKIVSYAQGFMLIREAARVNSWILITAILHLCGGADVLSGVFSGEIKRLLIKIPD